MPDLRRHRTHDVVDRRSTRRPRAYRGSSSYHDRYHDRDESRPRRSRYYDDHDDDDSDYYSDDDYDAPLPPSRRARHAAKATEGRGSRRPRSRSAGRHSFDEQISREKRDQAVKSALTAGAVEAFRQRNRPGKWLGEKGLRVATAAVSAAAIDSAVDKNPRKKGKRNVIGSTLGGLVIDKLANGMRQRH